MASFKLAAAALLALGTTTAFVPSFVPKSIQQSAIQTNALYSVANNQINNNAARAVSSSSLHMVVSDPTEVGGGRGGGDGVGGAGGGAGDECGGVGEVF